MSTFNEFNISTAPTEAAIMPDSDDQRLYAALGAGIGATAVFEGVPIVEAGTHNGENGEPYGPNSLPVDHNSNRRTTFAAYPDAPDVVTPDAVAFLRERGKFYSLQSRQ